MSESASAALENVRSAEGVPESYRVRLSGGQNPNGEVVISVAFAEAPQEADQVIEQSGTDVYVAPEVAKPLSTAVMDIQDTDAGLQLVFRPKLRGGSLAGV